MSVLTKSLVFVHLLNCSLQAMAVGRKGGREMTMDGGTSAVQSVPAHFLFLLPLEGGEGAGCGIWDGAGKFAVLSEPRCSA